MHSNNFPLFGILSLIPDNLRQCHASAWFEEVTGIPISPSISAIDSANFTDVQDTKTASKSATDSSFLIAFNKLLLFIAATVGS